MKKILLSFFLTALLVSCSSKGNRGTEKDPTLVVPGKSCEGFSLEETTGMSGFTSIVDPRGKATPLTNILNTQFPLLKFNRIAYMRNRYVLFLYEGRVKAVAGLSSLNRVTSDAVKLSDGVDNFILNYGNTGIQIIKDGMHRVYLYKRLGIALFDDYGNDTIDMYMIFSPEKKTPAE